MKALRFEKTGDLANLKCVEREVPAPAAGEALVRVKAAGINRSDTSNVTGFFPYTTVPRTPGRDYAGIVEQGPADLIGRAVFGTGREIGFTRDGSHAEYLTVPIDALATKPSTLSFTQAAACGVPYLTALPALDNTGVTADSRIVVIGAAGGVGTAALHLARMRGATVLGAVRKPEYVKQLADRGFDSILLTDEASLASGVRKHFPDGADMVFETTGAWLAQSVGALAKFGKMVVIVVPTKDGCANMPLKDLYRIGASIVGVNSLLYSAVESAAMLRRIVPAFEAGQLVAPDGIEERPLEAGPAVYVELKSGSPCKFVLVPGS